MGEAFVPAQSSDSNVEFVTLGMFILGMIRVAFMDNYMCALTWRFFI